MKAIKTFLLAAFIIGGAGYLAVRYRLIDFLQQTNQNPAKNQSPLSSPKQKAEIDFQIQQQYQRILNQQGRDARTEEERLKELNGALSTLDHATDEYDRELAVMVLGSLDDVLAKQGLLTALRDESWIVVTQAIRQITKRANSPERNEMLLTALQHNDDEIVLETLSAINAVDDQKLISRLKQLTKHPNPEIRDAANLALNLAD